MVYVRSLVTFGEDSMEKLDANSTGKLWCRRPTPSSELDFGRNKNRVWEEEPREAVNFST
jgi:hypothetical protein